MVSGGLPRDWTIMSEIPEMDDFCAVNSTHAFMSVSRCAYADTVCVPSASVAIVSEFVELIGTATAPMKTLTTKMAFDFLGLEKEQSVVVNRREGMFGGSALRFVREAGLHVCADDSTAAQNFCATLVPK